ncbi:hypothetical protein MRB53_041622 [Persea americana]|nr:hypothetical protein MRB53_041622 [Persea americana]
MPNPSTTLVLRRPVWQWDQLRIMKVGGNESATKYFQSHGGSAALASKDPKTKYTSTAATKYKEELTRRVAADAQRWSSPRSCTSRTDAHRYPGEVDVTDLADLDGSNGTSTPAAEGDDDFFSSWDKPTIKRPSNPPSRTATPSQVTRTASPFLTVGANGNGITRPRSPMVGTDDDAAAKPVVAAAVRKTPSATAGPRKTNILGAKKTTKLGAVKVAAVDDIDFEAAEKKAKEEAERIEKLGYDPDAETAPTPKATSSTAKVVSPTPVSPKGDRAEVERLGMGMGRLGFGQMASKGPAAAPAKKPLGFGSTGSRAAVADEADNTARDKFGTQKGISSDEFFGRNQFDPNQQAEAKTRLQGFEGATSISSNAYFGRPEQDGPGEDYGDLETAARDLVRKFGITAGDDLENVTQMLGEGAYKLRGECCLSWTGIKLTCLKAPSGVISTDRTLDTVCVIANKAICSTSAACLERPISCCLS